MTMTAAERKQADAYAGPHQSFPLYSSGAHLRAAWDLAGHSADPAATRAKIRAFARKHGLTRLLPTTAKAMTIDTDDNAETSPAVPSRTAGLVQLAYQHAAAADGEYGSFHRRAVIEHAQSHDIARHLPGEAHGFMHAHGMEHDHGDGNAKHTHPIVKALSATGVGMVAVDGGDQGGLSSMLPGRHVAAVLDAAFDLCMDADEGKPGQQFAQLIRFAAEHNLGRFLPERAVNAARAMDSGVLMGRVDDPLGQTQTPPGDISCGDGPPSEPGDASTPPGPQSQTVGRVDDPLPQGNPPGDVTTDGTPSPGVSTTPSGPGSEVPDGPLSASLVGKSVTLTEIPVENIRKSGLLVSKAWAASDGTCVIEGWVSTDEEDMEHDIVPPEAFIPSIDGYAKRRMPLSSEHGATKGRLLADMPIGHGQQVALIRDGRVLKSAKHPTDPADFDAFPNSGTGVYGRFVITEPQHVGAVRKGNIGGFSWVGNLTEYEPRSGRGRTFKKIDPWLESTIAAYPINDTAVVLSAKAETKES